MTLYMALVEFQKSNFFTATAQMSEQELENVEGGSQAGEGQGEEELEEKLPEVNVDEETKKVIFSGISNNPIGQRILQRWTFATFRNC